MTPGEIMTIAGQRMEVVEEKLIECERERMVDGKAEHYSFQYTGISVREAKP